MIYMRGVRAFIYLFIFIYIIPHNNENRRSITNNLVIQQANEGQINAT